MINTNLSQHPRVYLEGHSHTRQELLERLRVGLSKPLMSPADQVEQYRLTAYPLVEAQPDWWVRQDRFDYAEPGSSLIEIMPVGLLPWMCRVVDEHNSLFFARRIPLTLISLFHAYPNSVSMDSYQIRANLSFPNPRQSRGTLKAFITSEYRHIEMGLTHLVVSSRDKSVKLEEWEHFQTTTESFWVQTWAREKKKLLEFGNPNEHYRRCDNRPVIEATLASLCGVLFHVHGNPDEQEMEQDAFARWSQAHRSTPFVAKLEAEIEGYGYNEGLYYGTGRITTSELVKLSGKVVEFGAQRKEDGYHTNFYTQEEIENFVRETLAKMIQQQWIVCKR